MDTVSGMALVADAWPGHGIDAVKLGNFGVASNIRKRKRYGQAPQTSLGTALWPMLLGCLAKALCFYFACKY